MVALRARKDKMMETVYRMLCIALGKPPVRFTWETRDKDKKFIRISDITPQEFFRQYIGNLDDFLKDVRIWFFLVHFIGEEDFLKVT